MALYAWAHLGSLGLVANCPKDVRKLITITLTPRSGVNAICLLSVRDGPDPVFVATCDISYTSHNKHALLLAVYVCTVLCGSDFTEDPVALPIGAVPWAGNFIDQLSCFDPLLPCGAPSCLCMVYSGPVYAVVIVSCYSCGHWSSVRSHMNAFSLRVSVCTVASPVLCLRVCLCGG